ncbi:transcriptional repressor [Gordonia phage Asapag]|uniref:Immunity repressor n=1 Tax=Gordonia phage Asapag TaxID=2507862 RepID=A0A410TDQ9_9CAUD|nr:transcriptional repressor [Gordonia phage Asapag]QAU07153.1 immunity repressor [Gordonia phage Asapag]
MSALSDLLNSGTVSARQAADKAVEKGIQLPYGTIAAYWSGRHGRPTAATLKRLAQVVQFSEKDLQKAAWNATAPLGPYRPPEESVLLDDRQRQALDDLIRSIVAVRGERHDVTTEPTTAGRPGEATPRKKTGAAKRRNVENKPDNLTSPDQDDDLAGRRHHRDRYRPGPVETDAAAFDPPGLTDADEFNDGVGEGPDPEGPEHGA